MTDAQWAERITALAKDRLRERTCAFDNEIEQAIRRFLPVKVGYIAGGLCKTQILCWYLRQLHVREDEKPRINDEEWRSDQLAAEEYSIRQELTAKLDIFGHLRAAKGENWTPKEEGKP